MGPRPHLPVNPPGQPPKISSLSPRSTPVRNPNVASIHVDDDLVLAHEGHTRPRVLDAVGAVIWDALDGEVSLGDLQDDIEATLGHAPFGRAFPGLIQSLADEAFISIDGALAPVRPRRIDMAVDPEGCVGRRMGLGRATLMEAVIDGHASFRFGATDEAVVDLVASGLPAGMVRPAARDDTWIRTVLLRVTQGRTRRLQQLFDTISDPLYAGRDVDEAIEALSRTVAGLIDSTNPSTVQRVWVNAPALLGGEGVTLLHPSMHRYLMDDLRPTVFESPMRYLPAGLLELSQSGNNFTVTLPATVDGSPTVNHPLHAALIPTGHPASAAEATISTSHLMLRWDDTHLRTAARLAQAGPAVFLPHDSTVGDLALLIEGDMASIKATH